MWRIQAIFLFICMSLMPVALHAQMNGVAESTPFLTCSMTPCSVKTLACLPNAARASGNLAAFDWAAQTSRSRLTICLTRIHNALSDPALSVAWFELSGFHVYAHTRPPGHFREGETTVHASWRGSEESFPAPRVLPVLTRLLHGPTFSMAVHMDEDSTVESVQYGKAYK